MSSMFDCCNQQCNSGHCSCNSKEHIHTSVLTGQKWLDELLSGSTNTFKYLDYDYLICDQGTPCISADNLEWTSDDSLGILNPGKHFTPCFLSLRKFLKARVKHSSIIFNTYTLILQLVITLILVWSKE